MPRGRSAIKNLSDLLAIIVRGVLANIVLVLATLLLCALITWAANGLDVLHRFLGFLRDHAFSHTLVFLAVVVVVLIIWAVLRSCPRLDVLTEDTKSVSLGLARFMIIGSVIIAGIELQPLAINKRWHERWHEVAA